MNVLPEAVTLITEVLLVVIDNVWLSSDTVPVPDVPAIGNVDDTAVFAAEVTRPVASKVRTGICVVPP